MGQPFQTLKEAAGTTGLSQRFLRDGCKSGTVPHVKSGTKYYVNVPLLIEQLNENSLKGAANERGE